MSSRTRFVSPAAMLLALAILAGCAPLPPEPVSPAPPPAATIPVPAVVTPSQPRPATASPSAPDTVPSPAALAVLASIAEPLTEARASDPPGGRRNSAAASAPRTRAPIPAPAEAADSLRVAPESPASAVTPAPVAADSERVPVPAPTRALGQEAPFVPPITPPTAPPVAAPPVASPPPSTAVASADTCWRLQVGAPSVRAKGSRLREASESQLMVRMVVEQESGLFKVRSGDCMSRVAAESLKSRALASGFNGVFLVRYVGRR